MSAKGRAVKGTAVYCNQQYVETNVEEVRGIIIGSHLSLLYIGARIGA
jgi:hypothetical protein